MSQHGRILRWLRERGARGVHSFELVQAGMPRGAAVIRVLREEGYDIESVREPYMGNARGVRYILHTSVTIGRGPAPTPEPQLVGSGRSAGTQYDPYSDFS